jgi:hypothetical protein
MKSILVAVLCLISLALGAGTINLQQAKSIAETKVGQLYPLLQIGTQETLTYNDEPLAYVFNLVPSGYMVISAKEELPPLLAYSGTSFFGDNTASNLLRELIVTDLTNRLQSPEEAQANIAAWQNAFEYTRFTQWPPSGYSATEGWVETLWTQSAPYNWMCPMDLVTNARSVAGCPAIAMGQIVAYHKALNGTRFTDADDYHHNYGGNNYWVDNDFSSYSFPSFPQLNTYLDEINTRFRYNESLSDSLKAALVFACGTAATQVYGSAGSGTFSVSQALAAFQRFNFPEATLLTETSPDLYTRISNNVKEALPVHLAVVTPAWDSGHNVVVDGYNTNNYYHLNFGWGGQYNGWYLLPTQIPYGLTVVEGAIVDIKPYQYVLAVPDTLVVPDSGVYTLEIVNLHSEPVVLEAITPQTAMQNPQWQFYPSSPLPATIPVNGMMSIDIQFTILDREFVNTGFRLVLDNGFADVPVSYNYAMDNDDNVVIPAPITVSSYPNPFAGQCKFSVTNPNAQELKLEIYNLKGQFVSSVLLPAKAGNIDYTWNGLNDKGLRCPSGIYLYKIGSSQQAATGKLIKLY